MNINGQPSRREPRAIRQRREERRAGKKARKSGRPMRRQMEPCPRRCMCSFNPRVQQQPCAPERERGRRGGEPPGGGEGRGGAFGCSGSAGACGIVPRRAPAAGRASAPRLLRYSRLRRADFQTPAVRETGSPLITRYTPGLRRCARGGTGAARVDQWGVSPRRSPPGETTVTR